MKKEIRKVMLIYPAVTRPADFSAKVVRVSVFFPLGIAYLAAYLERTGQYEIEVLDAVIEGDVINGVPMAAGSSIRYGLTDQEIESRIKKFGPDVIGVSCLFSAMEWDAANVCTIAKKVDTDTITVVGGTHAGAMASEMLKQYSSIDYVVIGEGEEAFSAIIDSARGGVDPGQFDGVATRYDGTVKYFPKKRYIEDLDSLPLPARHLFSMRKYFDCASPHSTFKNTPYTQMITSRGCPCRCTFCALLNHWGPRQRMRSAGNVLDEIGRLIKDYGIKEIHFEDDNLTADKERALAIFKGIVERGYRISWNVPSGMAVYTLEEQLLKIMKESGCYSVSLAIESGNQKVLRELMNKPVDLKVVPGLVRKIREIGMDARGFFILGYPDETKDTVRQTIDFARQLELDWAYFFIASPIPHTKMYDLCVKKKYIKPEDFDPIRNFNKSIIRTPELSPEYLIKAREEAIVDINFRNNPNLLKYDIDKAIDNFKEVVKRYPHFDFANFYLGEAYLKKGDKGNAALCYRGALAANPFYERACQRLAELGAQEKKMTYKEILIHLDDSITDALKKLDKTAKKVLLVTDEEEKLLGTLTDGDIRRYILSGKSLENNIRQVYNKKPIYIKSKDFLAETAKEMLIKSNVGLIPILEENGKVVDFTTWDQLFSQPPKAGKVNIPVVIVAGGKGSRLEPFTKVFPKSLIPIGDKPVIEVIIEEFRKQGVTEFYITLNHKGGMVEAYFNSIEKDYKISYVKENSFLGTAGSLKLLEDKIGDIFIVSNCDVLVRVDLEDVIKSHKERKAVLTILSSIQHHKIPYGVVRSKEEGQVVSIAEKPEYTFTINTGVYIFNKECLRFMPKDSPFDMTDLIERLINENRVVSMYPVNESDYVDIGQWEEYKAAIERLSLLR